MVAYVHIRSVRTLSRHAFFSPSGPFVLTRRCLCSSYTCRIRSYTFRKAASLWDLLVAPGAPPPNPCPTSPATRLLSCCQPVPIRRSSFADCSAYAAEPLRTAGLLETANQYSRQDMCGSACTPILTELPPLGHQRTGFPYSGMTVCSGTIRSYTFRATLSINRCNRGLNLYVPIRSVQPSQYIAAIMS